MPDIKLRDGSGVETTYNNVDTISVPLADGSGQYVFGLTDEELNFHTAYYFNYGGGSFPDFEKYKNRIVFTPALTTLYLYDAFADWKPSSPVDGFDLSPIKIRLSSTTEDFTLRFNSNYMKKLPTIMGLDQAQRGLLVFENTYEKFDDADTLLDYLKQIKRFSLKIQPTSNLGQLSVGELIPLGGKSKNFDTYMIELQRLANASKDSFSYITYSFYAGQELEHLMNVPVAMGRDSYTSNNLFNFANSCDRTWSNFTFSLDENGSPWVMPWRGQMIDMSYTGYYTSSAVPKYWDAEDNIFYGLPSSSGATAAQVQERYDTVKNRPYWFSSYGSGNLSYDGKNIRAAILYSRYNHDSAVRTINSLPDTSAYLATAGGTNTIKFKYYSGALTDGGGCGDLTEEEIAVATAKGWTVAFNTSTT